jgi:hypothetical protein
VQSYVATIPPACQVTFTRCGIKSEVVVGPVVVAGTACMAASEELGQVDRGELPLGALCARPERVEAALVTFLFVEIAFSRIGVDWPYRGCDCYLGSQDVTSRSLSQQDLRTPGARLRVGVRHNAPAPC